MKFSTIAFTSATISAALAATYNVKLYAESSDSSVNGLGLSSIHEGAGINYFLLGSGGAQDLVYDDVAKTISATSGTLTQSVNVLGKFLALSVSGPAPISLDGDKLVVAGNEEFFAAKNVSDPYNYSKESFAVVTETSEGAIAINIKVVKDAAPSSSAGWTNGTTTTYTYTSPHTTVVTITSCAATVTNCPAKTSPVVVTTVIPVTLTTTWCPESTTPGFLTSTVKTIAPTTTTAIQPSVTKSTAASVTVPASSSASKSATPSVPSGNAGNQVRAAAGAAFVAGAALLF